MHFWIDAVCINQKDEAEKNEQVSMMGEGYQKAQRLVIWLGQSNGCRTQGVKVLIKRLANLGYENSLATAGSFPGSSMSFDLTDNNVFRRYGLPKLDDEIWFHLIDFFQGGWFELTWVLQEVVLAQTPVGLCGRKQSSLLS